jgi:hypothetical protein
MATWLGAAYMIKCMGSTGRMTVVLPHGALFRKELKVKLSLQKKICRSRYWFRVKYLSWNQLAANVFLNKRR